VPLELLGEAWLGDGGSSCWSPGAWPRGPRRTRMAQTLGEAIGETVGYRVRMQSKVSAEDGSRW
jgi:ATP-dependent helicase HrpB